MRDLCAAAAAAVGFDDVVRGVGDSARTRIGLLDIVPPIVPAPFSAAFCDAGVDFSPCLPPAPPAPLLLLLLLRPAVAVPIDAKPCASSFRSTSPSPSRSKYCVTIE